MLNKGINLPLGRNYTVVKNNPYPLVNTEREQIAQNSDKLFNKINIIDKIQYPDNDKITKLNTFHDKLQIQNTDNLSIEGEPIKDDTIEKGAKLEDAINHCKTIQEEYLLVHMKNIFVLYKLDKIHEFMNNINSQIQNINIDDNCIEKIKDKLNSRQNLIENFSDLSKIVNKIQNTKETQNLKGLTNINTNGELVTLTGGANQPGSLTSFIKDLKLKLLKL